MIKEYLPYIKSQLINKQLIIYGQYVGLLTVFYGCSKGRVFYGA